MSRTTALAAVAAVAAIALSACTVSEVPVPASPGRAAPVTELARPSATIVSANSRKVRRVPNSGMSTRAETSVPASEPAVDSA